MFVTKAELRTIEAGRLKHTAPTNPVNLHQVVLGRGVWSAVGALREASGDCVPHMVSAIWRVDVCGGRKVSIVVFGLQPWFQTMAGPFTNGPYI